MGCQAPEPAPLLATIDLAVRFGGFEAVRDVSIAVGPRAVHAVIGPNGAGKTTLFNAISGFVKPMRGSIVFAGADVTDHAPDRLARLGLARSFQICSIFPNLTVGDNIRVALTRDLSGWQLLRRRGRSDGLDARLERVLREAGLENEGGRRAGDLSYGRRRLLEIVTTIALEPKLLLLDEPTAGLAREDVAPVIALIRKVATRCGVLLVEHNLSVVESLATRVTVLAGGAVLCEGPYREVARDARVIAAYIGTPRNA
ncbi:ABC transporter ATP-binding protein [Bradyrhizobium sp.]|uniref:ABC transporter ATP-binding protein n=1 Tax=Bradyrhizobium sp. TaxID=376 RepID=UPI003C6F4626